MDQLIRDVQEVTAAADRHSLAEFKAGDTISVDYKIREGEKERIQQFRGVVIQRPPI